ncbi:MAG: hypothetical protein U0599_06770 [Vicinamibacteria bacterium]
MRSRAVLAIGGARRRLRRLLARELDRRQRQAHSSASWAIAVERLRIPGLLVLGHPSTGPGGFPTPEAYLEGGALQADRRELQLHHVEGLERHAFYSDSQFIGFGLAYKATSATEKRGSPRRSPAVRRPRPAWTAATRS